MMFHDCSKVAKILISFAILLRVVDSSNAQENDTTRTSRLEAWFQNTNGPSALLKLDRSTLFGAVAFNSPYLFGGSALNDKITCASCHNTGGISGPALTVKFDKEIPNLFERHWDKDYRMSLMPEKFIRLSIVNEFSGPSPSDEYVQAIGRYVRQLENIQDNSISICFDQKMVAGLAISIIRYDIKEGNLGDLDFLIETARFALGEYYNSGTKTKVADLEVANNQLKKMSDLIQSSHQIVDKFDYDFTLSQIQAELLGGIQIDIFKSSQ